MFSRILGFIAQNPWLIIIVLGGLFNVGVRMNQKVKEQRARRAALAEIQRRKAEALRTGKAVDDPIIVYDQEKNPPEDRQARIEALRQKRMEQLRAMREKRTGTGTQQSISSQTSPRQAQSSAQARPPVARTPAPQRSQAQRQAQRQAPPQQPRVTPKKQKPSRIPSQSRSAKPKPVVRKRPVVQQPTKAIIKPETAPKITPPSFFDTDKANRDSKRTAGFSGPISARSLLRDRTMLRQAIVVKEILDEPIALRDAEAMPGSMPN